MNKKWSTHQTIENFLSYIAISQGYHLTKITQHIDHSLPATELSRWMDTVNGHVGGFYHRVKHGHDFLANVGEVYNRFGVEGVLKYPIELLKDATTPHGIPFPGTQFLVEGDIVSARTATEWLSINVADVFAGGVSIYSTYRLWKKSKAGNIGRPTIIWATIGIGVKISAGVVTKNPVLIISGLADVPILILGFEQAKRAFGKFYNIVFSDKVLVYLTTAGAVLATGATLRALGFGNMLSLIAAVAVGYGSYSHMIKKKGLETIPVSFQSQIE